MATVAAVPEGFHTVTPYLGIDGCAAAIEFYKRAFGAEERVRMPGPDGKIGHAELRFGTSMVMMADLGPGNGRSAVMLCLYVEDCDALYLRAVTAGAKPVRPLADQFYGDRSGIVEDPYGNKWTIATHIEDVSPEKMRERMKALEH